MHGGVYRCVLRTVLPLTRPHNVFPLLILPSHSPLSFSLLRRYQVVIDEENLNDEHKALLQAGQPTLLPPWDPMGALAQDAGEEVFTVHSSL